MRKPLTLAISTRKGGVGKTTTTISLAYCLQRHGYRVLVVDVDGQGDATKCFGFLSKGKDSISEAILDTDLPLPVYELQPGLDLCPADERLFSVPAQLCNTKGRSFRLRDQLSRIKPNYDFILLDCPPALGDGTFSAFAAADGVIIPTEASRTSVEGVEKTVSTVNLVKEKTGLPITVVGALVTRFRESIDSKRWISELHSRCPYVFSTVIRNNIDLAAAQSLAVSVFNFKPNCQGAIGYASFAAELMDRLNKI